MIKVVARILVASAITLAATTGAEATVAYNNATVFPTDQSYAPKDFGNQLYASFSTSSTLDLSNVLLGLQAGTSNTAQLVVTLHADSSNAPGSLIATLGTVLDSQVGSDGIYQFNFATQTLAGSPTGTRYWIEVADTGTAQWNALDNASSTSTGGEYFSHGGTTYSNSYWGTNFQMCVSGNVGSCGVTNIAESFPTPEPASLALLGVAVVGLGLARSRVRRA